MEQSKVKPKGKVYICGAGPGDRNLLTIKASKLLSECDVILYDRLVNRGVLSMASSQSEKVYVGRESGDPTTNQTITNELMLKYAKDGKKILRLKGGDPFIFGRGGEEAEYLSSKKIKYEIVPGISSLNGAAVYSGIPLTHRDYSSSVVILTGHESNEKKNSSVNWDSITKAADTIVIFMGLEQLSDITRKLIAAGLTKSTKIAVIENATSNKQRVVVGNLDNIEKRIRQKKIQSPAIIIVGKVVGIQSKINWFVPNN
ncbi:MAG TPA: uroporphyrinogen-III C-methyltransferase [Nitrososphaeraceae archaeon]|nr:uroporphyrinogen-III C-methyltransferase [Nitrososphaeraceae archaeon]